VTVVGIAIERRASATSAGVDLAGLEPHPGDRAERSPFGVSTEKRDEGSIWLSDQRTALRAFNVLVSEADT
jgi:hypothetical protein